MPNGHITPEERASVAHSETIDLHRQIAPLYQQIDELRGQIAELRTRVDNLDLRATRQATTIGNVITRLDLLLASSQHLASIVEKLIAKSNGG